MSAELKYRSGRFINVLAIYLWPVLRTIFRIQVMGLENIPKSGPFLLIANHNSGALIESHSLVCLSSIIGRKVFGLNHRAIFKIPLIGRYFRKIGAVTASKQAAYEVLDQGHGLLIFPGGNRQALRPYKEKNNNSFTWSNGWIDIAMIGGASLMVPIVPVKFVGSHGVNPVFHLSKMASKLLILPWLLGVKWFPVTLSQLVFSMLMSVGCFLLGAPIWLTIILVYLTFIFSCLVPIVPRKITIKFYQPIRPSVNKDSKLFGEQLKNDMADIMNKKDHPQGEKTRYPLNGIESFMFHHETEQVHYNSQLIFEFEKNEIEGDKILETTQQWLQDIPHCRTSISSGNLFLKRDIYKKAWFSASDIVEFYSTDSPIQLDKFCHKKFDLFFEPPVRLGLFSRQGIHKLVFSCHHTIFDGAGQALAFEQWIRIYNGSSGCKPFNKISRYKYRSVYLHFGVWNSIVHFYKNFRFTPPRIQIPLAHLGVDTKSQSRSVSCFSFAVPVSRSIRKDFYRYSILALDQLLCEKGDSDKPMLFYLPRGIRRSFRDKGALQNSVISHNLFVRRNDGLDVTALESLIDQKIRSDVFKGNIKFLFSVLPLCKLAPSIYLKRVFKSLDGPERPIACTALLVNASIPATYETPHDWKHLKISARGTLLRSPHLGIILTGKSTSETVSIEYVASMVEKGDVVRLAKIMQQEMLERPLVNKVETAQGMIGCAYDKGLGLGSK